MRLNIWKTTVDRGAMRIVRAIVNDSPTPLTTRDIYKEAVRRQAEDGHSQPPTTVVDPPEEPRKSVNLRRGYKLPPTPPHPLSAIRSMRHLKTVVLPHMQDNTKEIEKIHMVRSLTPDETSPPQATTTKHARKGKMVPNVEETWVWKLKAPPPPPPEPKQEKQAFGAEVGVGEEWSHLNKRRQRAREEKVARDVTWLKDLEKLRRDLAHERTGKEKTA